MEKTSEKQEIVLDVGCGNRPKGDVNVDLYPAVTKHRLYGDAIKVHHIKNFVKADCHYLPFDSNVFDVVHCSHLIEHEGVNPLKLLRELIRVSKRTIIITCPHKFALCGLARSKVHARHYNKNSIAKLLKYVGLLPHQYKIEYSHFRPIPHIFMPVFQIPTSLLITISLYLYV